LSKAIQMDILVMGEESQIITSAFYQAGHNAYSVDFKESSGALPGRHIRGDMWKALFTCFPGKLPDMVICHPTCTYMANSSSLRLYINGKKENGICCERWCKMVISAIEFKIILSLPIKKIIVENPVMHCYAKKIIGVNKTQSVQPYQFGHRESKRTCLWLKGVKKLVPTKIITLNPGERWENQTKSGQNKIGPGKKRAEIRSKTYKGIADAMVKQWGSDGSED